jgi:transcriptional regulator with XRE-family HTH domain
MTVELSTPSEVQRGLTERFRARRLAANLPQQALAARSGVTLSSLKRFERTGLIALESLLKLATVLGCLGDFEKVAAEKPRAYVGQSLDSILATPPRRQRASRRMGRKP